MTIDFDKGVTTFLLQFTADPTKRLSNNREKAMRVHQQQIKKLNNPKNLKDKQSKIQNLGYVDHIRNLPLEIQEQLQNSGVHYHIPWRAVWKGNSTSSSCRIVVI